MATSAAASPSKDYGLPLAGDVTAWEDVMRPCTGYLQLYKAAGLSRRLIPRRLYPTLVTVTVWLHCGLHYKQVRQQAGVVCTMPVPGDMPTLDRLDSHFDFFPLRREEPGLDPFFSVRVFRSAPGGELHGIDGRWVIELIAAADTGHPLVFCARSKADATAWARQLRMRSAPLTVVWERYIGMVGNGTGGDDAIGAARGGPSEAGRLAAVAALHGGARQVLANDVLAGVAGVATELTHPEVHNIAVAAGPLVGVAFGALGFALRVFVAARSVLGAAVGLSDDLDDLHRKLRLHLLPALRDFPDDGTVDVGDLMNELGRLVSGVEVLAGELHHLVRSRRQRAWLAFMSTNRSSDVGGGFQARLTRSQNCANELLQLMQVGLQRRAIAETVRARHAIDAASPRATTLPALRRGLPELPPNVYVDWSDTEQPAAQLYAAVLMSDSTTCAAFGAHVMGGVGKTLSCLLVARRIEKERAGRNRFPDGTYWVQLSERIGDADVMQRVCDLATTLSGQLVVAHEMAVAVEHLREALKKKSCLVILDDVWKDRWAAVFIDALRSAAGSCLLLSTRRQDIATRRDVSDSVRVHVLCSAAATGVLMVHAESGGKVWADKTDERVKLVVSACSGLALALAVMGSLVHDHGWAWAVKRVDVERDAVFSLRLGVVDVVDEYKGSLWACLLASYRALDADEQLLWRARFQALCVVRPKEQLPWTALATLWGGNKPTIAVKRIAQTLRDRSLVTLHDEEGDDTFTLSLHDLVVEFLAGPHIMNDEQREQVHVKMVAKYCDRSGIGACGTAPVVVSRATRVVVRALWELHSDGFVERALSRLLCASGSGGREELLILLFNWRFIAWRLAVSSGDCGAYRMDGRIYLEDGRGVCLDLLDRVAAVVEGALSVQGVPSSARLQHAAWEVTERFSSRLGLAGGEAAKSLLAYLCDTARLCLDKPAVALYGASRLGIPQERRVFGCDPRVGSLCRVVSSSGDVILIAGQDDGKLSLWEERSGARVALLDGHTSLVTCLALVNGSRGGQVVSGSRDGSVRLWEVDSGKCVAVLEGHTDWINCLAVLEGDNSGGGERVVSGSSDGTLRVWDLDGSECSAVLVDDADWVHCMAVLHGSENGAGVRVVAGSSNGTLRVWELDKCKCIALLEGHTDWVRCLAVLDNGGNGGGGRVVSGSSDGTVRVWKVDSGECVAVMEGHQEWVVCLALLDGGGSGGGGRVVSGCTDGTLRVWEVDGGRCVAVLEGHTSSVRCIEVLDSGRSGGGIRVVSGSSDNTVRVWNVSGSTCAVLKGHTDRVRCLAVLDNGRGGGSALVVSGSDDGTVRVWEVDGSCDAVVEEDYQSSVTCLALMSGSRGGQVVSGSRDGSVRLWEVDSGKCVAVLEGHTDWINCLAVLEGDSSGGGERVVSGSSDGTLRVWDGSECVAVLDGHKDARRSLSEGGTNSAICMVVLDGDETGSKQRVVSGWVDGTVRVWEVGSGLSMAVLEGHTNWVNCLAVLGGGSGGRGRVVSGSSDGTVRVWEVDGGVCVAVLEGHTDYVKDLVVLDGGGSGGGGLILSRSDDGTGRVWELDGGKCEAVLDGHTNLASCLSLLQDLSIPCVGGAAVSFLLRACSSPAAALCESCVFLNACGMCMIYDGSGSLRYLPGPPSTSALCRVSPGRFAWGTRAGRVFFGRLFS